MTPGRRSSSEPGRATGIPAASGLGNDVMPDAHEGVNLTLEDVYAHHYGELVGFARKMLREANVPQSFTDPEDVVGNAFAKAYRHPARIVQPPYLYQIMRREILKHRRRARFQEQAADAARGDLRLEADEVSDLVSVRYDVHHALAGLPEQQRAAVWATKGLGWSQAEYAQAVQKRPGTVATHVSRAVTVLSLTLSVILELSGVRCPGCARTSGGGSRADRGRSGRQSVGGAGELPRSVGDR